jgi:hypothetical protein
MTVEFRVKKVVASIREVDQSVIDLASQAVPNDDSPRLASRLSDEFGNGVFRGLLPQQVTTVQDLIDAILPAMDAGPRYCTCSLKCGFRGAGIDGGSCPGCGKGHLICKLL